MPVLTLGTESFLMASTLVLGLVCELPLTVASPLSALLLLVPGQWAAWSWFPPRPPPASPDPLTFAGLAAESLPAVRVPASPCGSHTTGEWGRAGQILSHTLKIGMYHFRAAQILVALRKMGHLPLMGFRQFCVDPYFVVIESCVQGGAKGPWGCR